MRCPPRIGTPRTPNLQSLGWYFADIAKQMGWNFHEWQTHLADVSTELVPRPEVKEGMSTHKFNAQYVGCMVSRQSGKTAWATSRVLGQALLPNQIELADSMGLERGFQAQHIGYTAQSRLNAVTRWYEHVAIIQASPFSDLIEHVGRATGREQLRFHNGSTYSPVTPNRAGARGMSLDLIIVDEALVHPLWLLAALRPTQAQRHSARGCLGGQFVIISNAGNEDSELLNRMQELGHESITEGDNTRVWLEWSMNPDADPLDQSTWFDCLPTLGQPDGIDTDFLMEEVRTMKLEDFMREYLCVRQARSKAQLFPMERWQELHRPHIQVGSEVAIGVDITPQRDRATIAAVSKEGDYLPCEIVKAAQGTEWVLEELVSLNSKWGAPIVLDRGAQAGSLLPQLKALGVEVIELGSREVAHAAGLFYDAFRSGDLCHMNDYRLNDAVTGATKRPLADKWTFDKRGNVDISPLVAVAVAVWACLTGETEKPIIY